ncbi:nucleoporin NDC1 isoform X3 [Anguilla anguilla]|uniref:nucleoporin NDC1 isoform X3 n=1 Tax=Anguilla anguilla TaxID=7936 RepID=UPI0015AC6222|nr:nucleoporin NDC1 isoform X3 [Anguilla anguilla]
MFLLGHSHWFLSKVIWWRAAASTAWTVLLLPVTTALFIVLSKASLFHPIQWISESVSLFYGSYVIFCLLILTAVVLFVGFFNLEYYTVVPSIPCTRIALLGKVLHPQQFVHSLAHCMMGMVVAWCASVMIGGRYKFIASPCTEDSGGSAHQMCLNEYHLFLLLAGAFIGYSYSLLGVVRNMNYVSFHTVQQFKYLRFKGALPLVVKYSAVQSLYSLRNYCIFYFFFGYVPRAWICTTMNLHKNSSVTALDTVAGLLDLSLLYHLWISGTFLLVIWYTTMLLFKIYISEAYSVPVQSSFSEDIFQCLPAVLSGKEPMILKFLALQDLALLSQHSPSRRQEVFSLSQPGGHPHNWSAICKECLSLINDLTQRLVTYHEVVSFNGRAKPQSIGRDQQSTSSDSSVASGMEELAKTPWVSSASHTTGVMPLRSSMTAMSGPQAAGFTPKSDSPFASPAMKRLVGGQDPFSPWFGSVQSPHVTRRRPKLWTSSTGSPLNGSPSASPAESPIPSPATRTPSFLTLWVHNRQEQVKNFLAKRALIMYLFNKLPEASSQALFADSQAHIWALEGLSHLVVASYTEDRFGVVQTTFSSILSSMLILQEAVDKHFKLPHASSKPVRSSFNLEDTTYKTLRFALRAALKTAIYRITTTFGQHIYAVQMSGEHRKRLQQFMEYRE